VRRALAVTALALCLCQSAGPALGHTRSVSYSSWKLSEDGAVIRFRISLLELTRLPMLAIADGRSQERLSSYLSSHLVLLAGGEACSPEGPVIPRSAPEGWALYSWRVACPAAPDAIRSGVMLEAAPSHLHFARLESADRGIRERVLSGAEPTWELAGDTRRADGTSLAGYFALGVEHILGGWDHLAFVLALLLLATTLGEVATLVTGFTIAHSVTLGLAVLGVVRPAAAPVEALIGFSIALVAAENAWILAGRNRWLPALVAGALVALALLAALGVGVISALTLLGLAMFCWFHFGLLRRVDRPAGLRAGVAFAFGLVHGFGFAGVLAELELPTARLVPALFGFNLGVEAGQLAVVAASWPLLRLLQRARQGRWHRGFAELGSAAICGLGLFWFVSRTYG
jgi:hypothetical protein